MSNATAKCLGLAILTTISLSLVGCGDGGEQNDKAAPLTAVVVSSVTKESINPSLRFVGRTEAVEDVNIQARVNGYLLSMDFEEGVRIEKGDLLFEIDPKPYQAEVSRLQADVSRFTAALTNAKRNYRRGKELIDKGFISAMEMDNLISRKDQAKASLESSQAAVEKAKLDLSYTKMLAPISGLIGRKSVSIGDLVSPESGTLVTIVTVDPMYVTFDISEKLVNTKDGRSSSIAKSTLDLPIPRLELPNKEMYEHTGKFDFVDNRVDTATGTVKVRAIFPNEKSILLPGLYVTAVVSASESKEAILIPQSTVSEDQQGHFVMVVNKENEVEIRRVEMGERIDINWVVEKGLTAGEKVIVEGLQKVRPGQQVDFVEQTKKAFDETAEQ